jgi:hypothetical protein
VGEMLAESDEQKGGGESEEDGGECGLHGETPFWARNSALARPVEITRMPARTFPRQITSVPVGRMGSGPDFRRR